MENNEIFKLENHVKSYINEKKTLNMAKNTIIVTRVAYSSLGRALSLYFFRCDSL